MGKNVEYNNDVIPAVNNTVEVFFRETGTTTTSNPFKWYFELDTNASQISVQTDQIAQITEINGIVLKSPKPLAANSVFAHSQVFGRYLKYNQIKIKVLVANTLVEVFACC